VAPLALTYDPVRCFAKRAERGIDSAMKRREALSGSFLAAALRLELLLSNLGLSEDFSIPC